MGAFQLTTVLGSIINKQATRNTSRKGMTVQDKTLVTTVLKLSFVFEYIGFLVLCCQLLL
jgi:hypothetical protein